MLELPHFLTINGVDFIRSDDIGTSFAEGDSEQQASFLNKVAAVSAQWPSRFNQWAAINDGLTPEARKMIREWAEYFVEQELPAETV